MLKINARKVLDSSEVWEGLQTAQLFQAVLAVEVVLQVAIVQWGGAAFSTTPLSAPEWALCLGFGAFSLLLREGVRRVPVGVDLDERLRRVQGGPPK